MESASPTDSPRGIPLTEDQQTALVQLVSSFIDALAHEPRRDTVEQEYDNWAQAVIFANGQLRESRTFQPNTKILSHAIEPYNLSSVPGEYGQIAEDYNQACTHLFHREFPQCYKICDELQDPYWTETEGPHRDSREMWAPDDSLWIPIMFWKTSLLRILVLPILEHEENKEIFNTQIEAFFRTQSLTKDHFRRIPNPIVLMRLLIDEKARARLMDRGSTEKDLGEAGIVHSDTELRFIRYWYWYRPNPLVFGAPAAA
ncbi:MAG: hypothetical protein L6R38_003448 [Xanthoria sp. 2 TBL-2021]|nr:MAG: hypothetical protein L6R38_003448 [Xanthoria sp. 2 TBL-2021]